ncbi:formyltetrahydrofolate deformylase [Pseudomonas syringae pv. actinidiae]|nr:formyltetrahydrofolate deformylase [Pseudomonas syringae pv. actinidiae]
MRTFRLVIACPDRVGIVAKVSNFLASHNGWITEASHHSDNLSGWFFMRHEIRADTLPFDLDGFREAFTPIAEEFSMDWRITDSAQKKRVVLMASRESHCLADLLHRWHSDELDCDIACVISNHQDLRSMVEWHDIPYYHVPVDPKDKEPAFAEVSRLVGHHQADVVVLARYMQILSDDLCRQLAGRAINIHHSFLPGFKGAKPYHQAYERGVKLIGATAHYVTSDLDEGPIIEQEVQRVDHVYLPDDLVAAGRNNETIALSRAVKYHLEHRVFLNTDRTVIFR